MENNKELFESIFSRSLWDADTHSYLENIATEHPYFSPAQFYLLLLATKDSPAYKKQVQKTTALFNNNYWLNYLLATSSRPVPVFTAHGFESAETIADLKAESFSNDDGTSEAIKISESGATAVFSADEAIENANIEPGTVELNAVEESKLIVPETIVEEPAGHNNDTIADKDLPLAKEGSVTENQEVPFESTTIGGEINAVDEIDSLKNEYHTSEEEKIAEPVSIKTETVNDRDNELIYENISPPATEAITEQSSFISLENESVNAAHIKDKVEEQKQIAETKVQADALFFEPLHTSDYFASVGIKLSEEVISSDRLGRQMKSFTQWLKSMKKIEAPNTDSPLPEDSTSQNIDSNIQTLAERSNKEDDIITEAMADVLVQQGRITRAVEVLKKLSLLNPSKSTYFAAKIEQLKD